MTQQTRPGGLTAMAVINFIYGGFKCLVLVSTVILVTYPEKFAELIRQWGDEEAAKAIETLADVGMWFWILILGLRLFSTLIVFLSGVGYLKQKRVMGRGLGNCFALVEITDTTLALVMIPAAAQQGGSILNCMFLIYPILTLILLNVTFKEDFIR